MTITDFIYDGNSLSSLGYIICSIDSSTGVSDVASATKTFSSVSMFNGKFMPFTSVIYEDRLEFSFDICKYDCFGNLNDYVISNNEFSYLMRWLSRSSAKKFKLVSNEFAGIYYEGSFNVSALKLGDDIIGARLNFVSTRPFGLHEAMLFSQEYYYLDEELIITDISDEEGYIYPHILITCEEDGNLCLTNSFNGTNTIINGCSEGENIVITENLVIGSDMIDHNIQNDFNYEFLSIGNTFHDKTNRITSTMKCYLEISYCPIKKVVI